MRVGEDAGALEHQGQLAEVRVKVGRPPAQHDAPMARRSRIEVTDQILELLDDVERELGRRGAEVLPEIGQGTSKTGA